MNFLIDRLLGLSEARIDVLPIQAATTPEAAKRTYRFFVGVVIASAANIVIGLVFAAILLVVFRLNIDAINSVMPATMVIQEGLFTIIFGLLLLLRKRVTGIMYVSVRIVALFLIYWQMKIGVWLVATVAGSQIPFIKEGDFSWLKAVFPAFDEAMTKPGYAALITIVGLLLISLITKKPVPVHVSTEIGGAVRF